MTGYLTGLEFGIIATVAFSAMGVAIVIMAGRTPKVPERAESWVPLSISQHIAEVERSGREESAIDEHEQMARLDTIDLEELQRRVQHG